MPAPPDQILAFIGKATPSLDKIQRLQGLAIALAADGDDQGARDVQATVDTFTSLRQMQGKPTAHALGGMDRAGL